MKKNLLLIIISSIIILLVSTLILFSNIRQTSLIGIGQKYTHTTENFIIDFYTNDEYWQKVGCDRGFTIDECNVEEKIDHYELGCPVYKVTSSGGYSYTCPSGSGWVSGRTYRDFDTCEGQNQCSYDEFCSKYCEWQGDRDWGLKGGVEYNDFDDCSWWVQVKDTKGNLLQEFSAKEKYGEYWAKDNFYREPIKYAEGGMKLNFISSEYGVVQRRADGSSIKDCISIKFSVEDQRYKDQICLGNDGLDEPGCSETLSRTCTLSCPSGSVLNTDTCSCDEPVLECTNNLDCDAGYECKQNTCQIVETIPDEPTDEQPDEQPSQDTPEQPEPPTPIYQDLKIVIPVIILIILTLLLILRTRTRKK